MCELINFAVAHFNLNVAKTGRVLLKIVHEFTRDVYLFRLDDFVHSALVFTSRVYHDRSGCQQNLA